MLYLAGSILFATYLGVYFKVTGRLQLNTLQVIVFNYITCVITGSMMQSAIPFSRDILAAPWLFWAGIMGLAFISLFYLIGYSTQNIGVAITSVAFKLSLVIPFVFSIYLYDERISVTRWMGIVLAVAAVVFTCYQKRDPGRENRFLFLIIPLVIFAGSGLLDTTIQFTERRFLDGSNNNNFLITAFGVAAACGVVLLSLQLMKGGRIQPGAIVAGVLLGIPNYFSIWCLVAALKSFPGSSSTIIPVNNMAVVLLTAVIARLVFKEQLSGLNWAGILLSVVSILLLADLNL